MTRLASAIPVVAEQTGRSVVLVGGLAVLCRLSSPHRATTDLDTVDRRSGNERSQLDLLVAAGGVRSGPSGALVRTAYGDVQVDVLEFTDADIDRLPDDETHRLEVMSHAWAAATASDVVLQAQELRPLVVRVAEPGPLIAMKLQSVMNRGAVKEGTDLLDIIRITTDAWCGPSALDQLRSADAQLRSDALLHARRWFDELAAQSLKKIRAVPAGEDVESGDIQLAGELLAATLDG